MPAPYTKQALLNLIDTYIPAPTDPQNFPNIKAAEHRDLETRILDRVDGRIILTGTFAKLNWSGHANHIIYFPPGKPAYTNNYIVTVTPVSSTSNVASAHRATFTITGRTTTQFGIQILANEGTYNARFWFAVFSKEPL